MAAIRPYWHLIVYQQMMRATGRNWRARCGSSPTGGAAVPSTRMRWPVLIGVGTGADVLRKGDVHTREPK